MADLPRRTLGRTGLEVTTLGYGAMELRGCPAGGGAPLTDEEAQKVLNAVLDAGATTRTRSAALPPPASSFVAVSLAARRRTGTSAPTTWSPVRICAIAGSRRTSTIC